jgi:hypothetical protein
MALLVSAEYLEKKESENMELRSTNTFEETFKDQLEYFGIKTEIDKEKGMIKIVDKETIANLKEKSNHGEIESRFYQDQEYAGYYYQMMKEGTNDVLLIALLEKNSEYAIDKVSITYSKNLSEYPEGTYKDNLEEFQNVISPEMLSVDKYNFDKKMSTYYLKNNEGLITTSAYYKSEGVGLIKTYNSYNSAAIKNKGELDHKEVEMTEWRDIVFLIMLIEAGFLLGISLMTALMSIAGREMRNEVIIKGKIKKALKSKKNIREKNRKIIKSRKEKELVKENKTEMENV